jgi:anti-sigma factor RsiW
MLAYVDGCLPRQDHDALETAMAESPEIRRQIEEWRSQNEAIRIAFAEPAASGKFSAAAHVPARAQRAAEAKRQGAEPDRRRPAIAAVRERPSGDAAAMLPTAGLTIRAKGRRANAANGIFRAILGALALWCASALWPSNPSIGFVAAGSAAYRTFAGNPARPVEVATKDRAVLERWFAGQGASPAPAPDLSAAGFALIGGRIIPGAFSPAQFMLYENAGRERVAVTIEPLDSPPASAIALSQSGGVFGASWTDAGHGFAVLGAASGTPIARLARMVRDGESVRQRNPKQAMSN